MTRSLIPLALAAAFSIVASAASAACYADYKAKYQTEATPEQKQRFEETKPLHAYVSGHDKS